MTASNPVLSMRADLIRRRVWMGEQRVWVVKDPLARAFFYFSDQEYEILSLADGQRSLSQIASECSRRVAPQYMSAESVVQFFADARTKGLVTVDGSALPARDANARRRWWHNPLAIRLPGLNPDRFLDLIGPYFKPLFTPASAAMAALLVLLASMIAVRDFATLAEHLTTATTRIGSGQGLLILMIVISLTKIIHELAHALACKYFGGECRELGVMLLVGIPCLYCDVSDAWLLDRRWKRILISAAGMAAELTLAGSATCLWLFTADGPVRDVCVMMMVVCSVSTVLFNGNPLLRYDGYYILCDLIGIPNLASESSALIRGWFRRFLWATPAPRSGLASVRRGVFLVTYGLASGLYRLAVYTFILYMLYRLAESYEVGGPVGLVALFALGWFCFKWGKSILSPPERSVRRASMTTRRPAMIVSTAVVAGVLVSLVPLPRSVVAPMSIQPADAQSVFVTASGAVADAVLSGTDVTQGQVIANLRDPAVDRDLLAIASECERLAVQLESLRRRRSSNSELSAQIPAVEKAYEEALKQKRLQEYVAAHLVRRSPRAGRVFAPENHHPQAEGDHQQQFWTGTPLEPTNRGAWLDEGTLLCVIGDPAAREAIVFLHQQDIELIRTNQQVTLLLADRGRGAVTGRVLEVAASPVEQLPAEVQRLIGPATVDSTKTPFYQVRVSLDPTLAALPVRLTGRVRISVSHASIYTRIGRFLRDSFG